MSEDFENTYPAHTAAYLRLAYPANEAGPVGLGGDYFVACDAEGCTILHWSDRMPVSQPTPEDLAAAAEPFLLRHRWAASAQQRKHKEAEQAIAKPLDDPETQKRINALNTLRRTI